MSVGLDRFLPLAMMTTATDDAHTSPESASPLPTSVRSSAPSEMAAEMNTNEAASDRMAVIPTSTMEEQKEMAQTASRVEHGRYDRLQEQREDDLKGGDEVMDIKFKRLQYLLGQSKV